MKNQKNIFRFILTAAALSICLFVSNQNTYAQRYLSEFKDKSPAEAQGIAQFAADLAEFLQLANNKASVVSPRDLANLERAGRRVKDGSSNFRSNLQALVTKLKNNKQWDNELDTEINNSLGSRRAKGFFQRIGGRKILTDVDGVISSINADVDAILNEAKKPGTALLFRSDPIFTRASFTEPGSSAARKVRFKCVVLGAAIFGAEVVRAPKTAENLDNIFDSNGCGSASSATTE